MAFCDETKQERGAAAALEMTFRLESFEGPLDLLLHLIQKNKVSIYDIPITEILSQYMEILHQAQSADMDVAGDFIAMAAQLVFIKSKMLLPVHDDEQEEDPRAQLVEMLLEYQRIKEVTPFFRAQSEIGRDIYTKSPEIMERSQKIFYRNSLEDLTRAARNMLQRIQRRMPPPVSAFTGIVGREPAPVSNKITEILKKFLIHTRLRFKRLFDDAANRSEIVATFLAVLELSKNRNILIEGEGEETEIVLTDRFEEDT